VYPIHSEQKTQPSQPHSCACCIRCYSCSAYRNTSALSITSVFTYRNPNPYPLERQRELQAAAKSKAAFQLIHAMRHISFHLQKSESLSARAAKGAASSNKVESSISANPCNEKRGGRCETDIYLILCLKLAIVKISHHVLRHFRRFSIDQ
jgi:hypothetical protein